MPDRKQRKFEDLENTNAIKIAPVNSKYSIGFLSHGPELTEAVKNGKVDKIIMELASLYREVYGREPWNEYLVCRDKNCGKKTGLQPDKQLAETDREILSAPEKQVCPDCKSSVEFYYHPGKIISSFQKTFQDKIFACLLLDQERTMDGFAIGFETTVREGYRDKAIVGTGDTDPPISYEEYLQQLRSAIGNFDEDTKLLNIAEWGTSPKVRGDKAAFPLLHSIIKLGKSKMAKSPEDDVPGIAHTLNDSKAHHLMKHLGTMSPVNPKNNEVRLYSTTNYALKKIESFNK